LQDIAAPFGDPAVLEVRLGPGLPAPSVHWYHNNKPARESKDKDIRFLSNGWFACEVVAFDSTLVCG